MSTNENVSPTFENLSVDTNSEQSSLNQDHYEFMATVVEVRPISVTETISWNSMSKLAKISWMIGTLLQMLFLTIFSLRIDRLCDRKYLKNHWKHYSGSISKTSILILGIL